MCRELWWPTLKKSYSEERHSQVQDFLEIQALLLLFSIADRGGSSKDFVILFHLRKEAAGGLPEKMLALLGI